MTTRSNITERTVLLVDSEVMVRMPLAAYLRDCGYRVIEAADIQEARTFMQKREDVIDVLFIASSLSGTTGGFSLAQWAREHRTSTKVVLAATPKKAAAAAGDLCEQGPHLKKPYSTSSVEAEILRLLATKRSP